LLCCFKYRGLEGTTSKFWNFVSRGEYVRTFLKNYYAPFLMLDPVRVSAPLFTACSLRFGIMLLFACTDRCVFGLGWHARRVSVLLWSLATGA
jgi:hypothetical protein